jgi:hypothetical protein
VAALLVASFLVPFKTATAEQLPPALRGSWRIERILPTANSGCWTHEQAESLVGSTLTYSQNEMRWRGGVVALDDIFTREVSASEFRHENTGPQQPASFEQIGVRADAVTEVDMQHPDAAVLPASTEIPGDLVLMVAPDRIVVSACGVYFEATRLGSRTRAVRTSRERSESMRSTGR